jgi:hypothetical protein
MRVRRCFGKIRLHLVPIIKSARCRGAAGADGTLPTASRAERAGGDRYFEHPQRSNVNVLLIPAKMS